ncbi:dynein axonemal intermediate chain 4-like [Schistocerca nitens]|uniref:dynein axonemal intermediate chain 4-like n=1 Tax=Schistocerca nitens TaxID=7011 RepID=UPI0021180D4C|nr:dynein axonemal intermediate chain 4-like [Schistocerca nitens]
MVKPSSTSNFALYKWMRDFISCAKLVGHAPDVISAASEGGRAGCGDARAATTAQVARVEAARDAAGGAESVAAAAAGRMEGQLPGEGAAEAAAARPRGRPSLTSRRSQLSRRSRSSEQEAQANDTRPSATSSSSAAEDARLLADHRRQLEALAAKPAFAAACATVERVLASNVFRAQQKIFKGLTEAGAEGGGPRFRYHVRPLWVFECERVSGRSVSALCWSAACGDLLAAAYGKFHYGGGRGRGAVCVWCVKNPAEPERAYGFGAEVSSLRFCPAAPNLLAVGFYDGAVALVDVSAAGGACRVVARGAAPVRAPVWHVEWLPRPDAEEGGQQLQDLLAADQEGRISRFALAASEAQLFEQRGAVDRYRRNGARLEQTQVMRVPWPEGAVRGVAPPPGARAPRRPGGEPPPPGEPVSCFAAALVLALRPGGAGDYLVGTDAGCVHVCSTRSLHRHLDHFRAHRGPVYSLQYSPFCPQVLLTAGGDGCVRVWRQGAWQALATLRHGAPLQAACWSPSHATLLAAAAAPGLFLWDLRRAAPSPASATAAGLCTQLLFTPSGRGLVAGDAAGRVHVFALEDAPFPPFFQADALADALRAAVLTRPQLARRLRELGPPFG